ncbi:MAG: hypothetical protein WCJ94_01200 [bacterium]
MNETSSRININQTQETISIRIKSHNPVLHAFFVLLIISAIFMALVLVFAVIAAIVKYDVIISVLSTCLATAAIVYKVLVIFAALRAFLWMLAGEEVVLITKRQLIYTKKIAGIGFPIAIDKKQVIEFKVIDFIREKDVIHMILSEIGRQGRAFELKTEKKNLKFGIYISMDDAYAVEKIIKLHLVK